MSLTVPLTIAIPTYNRTDRVVALVRQIHSQMEEGDELIVSDDSSQNETRNALASLSRVSVVQQKDRLGMVGNWNFCLDSGRNQWICLIHDDDKLLAGGLSVIRQVCAIASRPAIIANAEFQPREHFESGLQFEVREPGAAACIGAQFCPSGVIIHRDVVARLGKFSFDYPYSADMEYFPRICATFPSYIITNPRVIEYVHHANNYAIATWRKPDFLEQLEQVETAAVSYAGLDMATADQIVSGRLIRGLFHMLTTARRAKDRDTIKSTSRELRRRGDFGKRWRIALYLGEHLGWYPFRLPP
jgi:glycosyltransferase involved in cell wall biosynthesis